MIYAQPAGSMSVDYSAYFFKPGKGEWIFLAQIRVGTGGHPWSINGLSSFVERFLPVGTLDAREGRFGPSFVASGNGADFLDASHFLPITRGVFEKTRWPGSSNNDAGLYSD